jgi:hypothetical protein
MEEEEVKETQDIFTVGINRCMRSLTDVTDEPKVEFMILLAAASGLAQHHELSQEFIDDSLRVAFECKFNSMNRLLDDIRHSDASNEARNERYNTGIQKCFNAISVATDPIDAYMILQYAAAAVAARYEISDELAKEMSDEARSGIQWESSH